MRVEFNSRGGAALAAAMIGLLAGCSSGPSSQQIAELQAAAESRQSEYRIGPGDSLQIFVWQHPDVSVTVPVRPDGRISTPLVEDLPAVGKTPTQLARDIEVALSEFIRAPTVSVIVSNFVGTFDTQVRVVGQATAPQSIPYRQNMSILDVMIQVGGLAPTAAGNRARIVRTVDGVTQEIPVRLKALLNTGDISANLTMLPGDILIIPESRL